VIAICLLIDTVLTHATTYSIKILVWARAPGAIGDLVAGRNVQQVAENVPDTGTVRATTVWNTHTGHPHTNVHVPPGGQDGTVQHTHLTACQDI